MGVPGPLKAQKTIPYHCKTFFYYRYNSGSLILYKYKLIVKISTRFKLR